MRLDPHVHPCAQSLPTTESTDIKALVDDCANRDGGVWVQCSESDNAALPDCGSASYSLAAAEEGGPADAMGTAGEHPPTEMSGDNETRTHRHDGRFQPTRYKCLVNAICAKSTISTRTLSCGTVT
jgi:hypothetical protein